MIVDPQYIYKIGAVKNLIDPKIQIQPNGIDLTVQKIWSIPFYNDYELEFFPEIDFTNENRNIPDGFLIFDSDENEVIHLGEEKNGTSIFVIQYHEEIEVPENMMAQVFHRSSLMRCGGFLLSSVWDSGYKGRGTGLLMVQNGTILHKFARLGQIVFHEAQSSKKYNGIWQNEGVERT